MPHQESDPRCFGEQRPVLCLKGMDKINTDTVTRVTNDRLLQTELTRRSKHLDNRSTFVIRFLPWFRVPGLSSVAANQKHSKHYDRINDAKSTEHSNI